MDNRITRESNWAKKSSTIQYSHQVFNRAIQKTNISADQNEKCDPILTAKKLEALKKNAKHIISRDELESETTRVKELTIQGKFLDLMTEEDQSITWKSSMFSFPKGVLAWALRACTDSLPTQANLARWNKVIDNKCKLCIVNGNPSVIGTLHHILNACPILLERYTWRHDSVLTYVTKQLTSSLMHEEYLYADLEGFRLNDGTIPSDILPTASRPDIVIVDKKKSPTEVTIIELTVPFEPNINKAEKRKTDRYAGLVLDIQGRGFNVSAINLEIGSRGYINVRNKLALKSLLRKMRCKNIAQTILDISRISLLSSFSIYHSRQDSAWVKPPVMSPN